MSVVFMFLVDILINWLICKQFDMIYSPLHLLGATRHIVLHEIFEMQQFSHYGYFLCHAWYDQNIIDLFPGAI